jgi:hypothetical protein
MRTCRAHRGRIARRTRARGKLAEHRHDNLRPLLAADLATYRSATEQRIAALIEAACAMPPPSSCAGNRPVIETAMQRLPAQRGQLRLPLEDPGRRRSRSRIRRRRRSGRHGRSGIMRAPATLECSPWNSPRALNRQRSNVAGTPNGKPEATSAPASMPTKPRSSASCCHRPTSPAPCTWDTASTRRSWTRSPAIIACGVTTRCGNRAPITRASPRRSSSSANSTRRGFRDTTSAARKFLEKVWQWKEFSGDTITRQMRRLGTSPDWSRERFTMDAGLSRTVTETFVRLYQRRPDLPRQAPGQLGSGAADRGLRPRRWCRKKSKAISGTFVIR